MPFGAPYVAAATAVEQFAEEESLDGRVLDYTGVFVCECFLGVHGGEGVKEYFSNIRISTRIRFS